MRARLEARIMAPPRQEFKLTPDQLATLLDASQPTPVIKIGNYTPAGPQQNANAAWRALGEELGFRPFTVRPVPGKDHAFFTAEPV